jgi:hypothetical protein
MRVEPDKQTVEYTNEGGILSPTIMLLSNKSTKLDHKAGVFPGMWARRKGKEEEYLPEEFDAVVVSYVPFKLAYTPTGDQLKKGEAPFCSSVLEHTSLRWNPKSKEYESGPSCSGDLEKGIKPCPFFEEGKSNKTCNKGMIVYLVFKDGTYSRLQLRHQFDIDKLMNVLKKTETYEPITVKSVQNGQWFNPEFEVSKNGKDFSHLDFASIEARIDAEITGTVAAQRGA